MKPLQPMTCAFCGKSNRQRLFASRRGRGIYVCSQCVERLREALEELVIAIGEEVRARPPLPAKPYRFTTPRLEKADLQARAALAGEEKP